MDMIQRGSRDLRVSPGLKIRRSQHVCRQRVWDRGQVDIDTGAINLLRLDSCTRRSGPYMNTPAAWTRFRQHLPYE
ncbi:hypothetical protein PISMIDRAFT_563323 [Pisolithus microcarpus 441]|uniref:Uncharacterized protein n=1 Tax=Pisolithus microcarpus 441 TaxID=765257 RepID=A0A0C9Y941_9AGAM|nr:hypothetical protein PISMIDRAFT_563323 [Pisolithus microcarpus 441]